ncbi:GxxExxY protein [Pedobacter fastidiosus]|uniref:GxxExxY protein n=1 Tax=Pedobacter fastidiosus TaxID=2765361 RepID=A0ABR7KMS0_9SPHI|nr:GxxExxY protein [Pedobacter fastidiosus]MBC6109175.1 GxxExxY protein [Pedobacter fastidiosus]
MLLSQTPNQFPFQTECSSIIEIAMEVHRSLGRGFDDSSYKEAFSKMLKLRGISFEREKKFGVNFCGILLEHQFYADFVIEDNIIVEVRSIPEKIEYNYVDVFKQLVVNKPKLGLTINFYEELLRFKQVALVDKYVS